MKTLDELMDDYRDAIGSSLNAIVDCESDGVKDGCAFREHQSRAAIVEFVDDVREICPTCGQDKMEQ